MDVNSNHFSTEDALRLISSPAGQQLMALLQQSDDPGLRKAMEQAARGDFTQAKQSLSAVAASEEVRKLLKQMGG